MVKENISCNLTTVVFYVILSENIFFVIIYFVSEINRPKVLQKRITNNNAWWNLFFTN